MKYLPDISLDCLSPELRLIVQCLRRVNGREDIVPAVRFEACDWGAFLQMVDRHRVISPVYRCLSDRGTGGVPETVLAGLRDRHRRTTERVLVKTAELLRVLALFAGRRIPILPLKGPAVAMQVFGDIGSRHVGDLDLLVPPGFALEAERLLIEDGYRRMIPGFELTPKQTRAYVRHRPHFHYVHPKSGIHLELHWRFGLNRRLFRFTFDELWREKQILRIGGRDIFVLSLKHTILLLCVHGSAHAWFRLFWLNDISHFLINDETLDWEAVMGDA